MAIGYCGGGIHAILRTACLLLAPAKAVLFTEHCWAGAIEPLLLAAGWQNVGTTNDAVRVAGPDRVLFSIIPGKLRIVTDLHG